MTDLVQQASERNEPELVEQTDPLDSDLLADPASSEHQNPSETSLASALRTLFSWRNYSVYLTTSWVISASSYIGLFLNLYLRELSWEYVTIGLLLSVVNFFSTMGRLIGGYVGDVANRKHLAVIATLCLAVYNILLGLSASFTFIFAGLLFLALVEYFKGGSTAYIMDNIPKEHGGLGISLFSSTGRAAGVVLLVGLALIVPVFGFTDSIRTLYLVSGIALVLAGVVRGVLLKGGQTGGTAKGRSHLKAIFNENKRTAGLLLRVAPGLLAVVVVDGLSDSMFRFGANLYIYEIVGISYEGIIIMTLATALLSIPLLLLMGRSSDKKGVTRAALLIYGFMPVCAAILVFAPVFSFWAPAGVVSAADLLYPGLGAIFSTPFIAVVIKSVNDSLWYLILLTIIQKNLPGKDTAKILGTFWFLVYLSTSIGPSIAGIFFQYLNPQLLFVLVLILNVAIMATISRKGLISESAMQQMNVEKTS